VSRKQPIVYNWKQVEVTDEHGEIQRVHAMVPLLRYHNVAQRQFAEGAEYILAEVEERSRASHNHYFAALHQGFENLPEKIQARFPTIEHMRAWMLIETGCCEEKEFRLANETERKRLGTFIRTQSRYARLTPTMIDGFPVLIVRTPLSQSMREMGKREFEASKKKVLDLLEAFVGVPLGTLMKNAKESARRHDE
jgi:hypothetical protein